MGPFKMGAVGIRSMLTAPKQGGRSSVFMDYGVKTHD